MVGRNGSGAVSVLGHVWSADQQRVVLVVVGTQDGADAHPELVEEDLVAVVEFTGASKLAVAEVIERLSALGGNQDEVMHGIW